MPVFGSAFADLQASLRRQQDAIAAAGGTRQPSTAEGAQVTQPNESNDEDFVQPDIPVNPDNVMPTSPQPQGQATPAQGGLGMSRDDWLRVGDIAATPRVAFEADQMPQHRQR